MVGCGCEVVQKGLRGDSAGDLSGGGSAHAVADEEEHRPTGWTAQVSSLPFRTRPVWESMAKVKGRAGIDGGTLAKTIHRITAAAKHGTSGLSV